MPATRTDFWKAKLEANEERDRRALEKLQALGWRTLVVWECFIRTERDAQKLKSALSTWIEGDSHFGELSGELC